ncbi:ABC transporter ATP-binding protein [Oscillibacter sp. MSJ-2]|uniref:ABC transporter ATP-binding protein n=1 Tax=Dysosmobacter acutus TaxID=2841504 RepID=A0ABS6F8I1_9FIRM|nr:ABC transporter ATP-binding protein [Dysosmobacter acutus]MBU5626581.1 ABC transporter ATP-binding protein [Dysosmobacter acutus]
MEDYIVEMRHITKRFPGIVANDDVTIQVKRGEVYALLGENGAGKSTLMSMLFGMYEPDIGEIYIQGEKVKFRSSNDATAHNIGMVHQHFKLVDNYTVAENIVLGVEPMKKLFGVLPCVDIKTANREIAELSKKFGLEVNPTDKIEDIPVSVRQRVEILKMLYRKAEILIFDEPTAVLTPQEIEFLLKIIDELRKGGKTIILITHKIEEIKKIADRCAILYRGKLVNVLDVKNTSSQDMANMMVGRQVDFNPAKKPADYRGTVLEVKNLTVRNANKFDVVKDVSFQIRAGEVFAIAGVSGNGQVEVADAIAGLTKAHSGSITLGGKDITALSIRQRTEAGISYIPEDRQGVGVFLDFNLGDNLALRKYYKAPFSKNGILQFNEFEKNANELIDRYDIRCGQGRKTSLRSMSGGNQQKAIIAREIEEHAKLIIFVQPTRGLDIGAIENIHRQILEERDKGTAILLISLELDEIMELADTIGVIYNGQLLKIADASTLTSHDVGKYMMGVKEA